MQRTTDNRASGEDVPALTRRKFNQAIRRGETVVEQSAVLFIAHFQRAGFFLQRRVALVFTRCTRRSVICRLRGLLKKFCVTLVNKLMTGLSLMMPERSSKIPLERKTFA
jgi:hypothetical protein